MEGLGVERSVALPRRRRLRWFWLLLIIKVYVAGALFVVALLGLSLVELLACLDEQLAVERRGLALLVGLASLGLWLVILRMAVPRWRRGSRRAINPGKIGG